MPDNGTEQQPQRKETEMKKKILVQVILSSQFEDVIVEARNDQEAIRKAKKQTSIKSRWAEFVIA